ncbi:hypothetical protein H8K20_02235 [Neobittarella massiliensis]|uniref:Uncharacterized protein n=1 Tax=Neobittarella massiliensis (ex Bilen et al. 2018) TaxID=2041842 RepID=A0A8J6IMG8_9FIRM|nr:hypothetical protein [Neobittarella massiliensis]MBC3515212.1 hypothetical protein [Neobittarella massiliensis]
MLAKLQLDISSDTICIRMEGEDQFVQTVLDDLRTSGLGALEKAATYGDTSGISAAGNDLPDQKDPAALFPEIHTSTSSITEDPSPGLDTAPQGSSSPIYGRKKSHAAAKPQLVDGLDVSVNGGHISLPDYLRGQRLRTRFDTLVAIMAYLRNVYGFRGTITADVVYTAWYQLDSSVDRVKGCIYDACRPKCGYLRAVGGGYELTEKGERRAQQLQSGK